MYGSVEEGVDEQGLDVFRVMENVDLKKLEHQQILMEWVGGSLSDMIADSVLALLLGMDHSPATVKCKPVCELDDALYTDVSFAAVTTSPHHHSHEHTADKKVAPDQPSPADEVAMAQLDRLIAFLDTHFGAIELLAPSASLAAQLSSAKGEEKADGHEEGEFDTTPKLEGDTDMQTDIKEEGKPAANGTGKSPPASSAPVLKLHIDDKDVYIPVDTMVRTAVLLLTSLTDLPAS